MKIIIGLILGFSIGYLITEMDTYSPEFMHDTVKYLIQNVEYIQNFAFKYDSRETLYSSISVWLIVSFVNLPMYFLLSISAAFISIYTKKPRIVFYSILIYPIYYVLRFIYYYNIINTSEMPHYFVSSFGERGTTHSLTAIFNTIVFCMFFMLFYKLISNSKKLKNV